VKRWDNYIHRMCNKVGQVGKVLIYKQKSWDNVGQVFIYGRKGGPTNTSDRPTNNCCYLHSINIYKWPDHIEYECGCE